MSLFNPFNIEKKCNDTYHQKLDYAQKCIPLHVLICELGVNNKTHHTIQLFPIELTY